MRRNYLLFYVTVILVFGAGISLLLQFGSHLQPSEVVPQQQAVFSRLPASTPHPPQAIAASHDLGSVLYKNLRHPLSILLLQLIMIILTTRGIGKLFLKIQQPAVIGEMVAGILLGPSFVGMLFPGVQGLVFPESSMDTLRLLSQIGVVLFMFAVGLELDVQQLRKKAHAAVLVSHASIIVPFFLGTAFSLLIYTSLAHSHISFSAFALFTGISMSITAFPVLARIIEERRLSQTPLGNVVIACAAVDDVTAWCLLAIVVAITQSAALSGAMLTISLALLFIGLMLFLIKSQVERIFGIEAKVETLNRGLLASLLTFAFASALFTEVIGIHALFGAFLAGAIMPTQERLMVFLRERLEMFSAVFLLPLFFAFTGLRTQIGLLNDWQSWGLCAGIVMVAIAGKLGGSTLAARWTGMSWHDALSIGALMNTRGLMELIALNIGYDLGILSPRLFAMMVLMALATTFMAGPLLWIFGLQTRGDTIPSPKTSIAI
jgi:Kef-type K+ transport system membrane component KefB